MSSTPTVSVTDPGRGVSKWSVSLALAAAAAAAAFLGYALVDVPDLLPQPASLSFLSVVILIGFVPMALLVVRRTDIGLVLLVCFVYLNLSQILVRFHHLPSLLQLLAAVLFVAAVLERDGRDLASILGQRLTVLLSAYCLVLLFSSILAWEPERSDARFLESLKAFGIYCLVVMLAGTVRRVRGSIWAMVASGSLLAVLGLMQEITGSIAWEFGGLARIKRAQIYADIFESRIAGPLGDPNFFAQILLILVPLAIFLAWSEKTRWGKVLGYAAAGLCAAATLLTYSRGGTLALACVLILTFFARGVSRRGLLLGILVLGLVLALRPAGFMARLTTLGEILPTQAQPLHPDSSFEKRWLVTRVAWNLFVDHPFLGVGAGNYTVHFDDTAEEVGSAMREYKDPTEDHLPHNLYLEVGAETGLLGLSVFAVVVTTAFIFLSRSRRRFLARNDPGSAALVTGTSIALTGYLVSSIFLHGDFQRYLWLLFGLATALHVLSLAPREGGAHTMPRDDVA